jgi:hypothetical protein
MDLKCLNGIVKLGDVKMKITIIILGIAIILFGIIFSIYAIYINLKKQRKIFVKNKIKI